MCFLFYACICFPHKTKWISFENQQPVRITKSKMTRRLSSGTANIILQYAQNCGIEAAFHNSSFSFNGFSCISEQLASTDSFMWSSLLNPAWKLHENKNVLYFCDSEFQTFPQISMKTKGLKVGWKVFDKWSWISQHLNVFTLEAYYFSAGRRWSSRWFEMKCSCILIEGGRGVMHGRALDLDQSGACSPYPREGVWWAFVGFLSRKCFKYLMLWNGAVRLSEYRLTSVLFARAFRRCITSGRP